MQGERAAEVRSRLGRAHGDAASSGRSPGVTALLRLPLLWKIVGANVLTVGLAAAGAAWIAHRATAGEHGLGLVPAALLATTLVVAGLLLNGLVIRAALAPLADLERAARRAGSGDVTARATTSPLMDPRMSRLAHVFNGMLESLERTRAQQLELARRVLESEERERQRIAHELYQGTAQTLAGILVRLRIAERQLRSGATGSIEEIREEVVSALEEVRGVARRLRPPELDELGVRAALEAHARSIVVRGRPEVCFTGSVPELAREAALALFRIVQEAISNAVLHGDADRVDVRFESDGTWVTAEIRDDGVGFDPSAVHARSPDSLGLFGMRERAGYVGGTFFVESAPGSGTRVRVRIPTDPAVVGPVPEESSGGLSWEEEEPDLRRDGAAADSGRSAEAASLR